MASWRARLRRWFRPPRKFRLTREGKWFIGATLLLGFAAVNGGINLLFLMFGMLLCLLIANGILSESAMRRLHVERHLPGAIHAGSAFLMGISVRNDKRRVPTFCLEVEDVASDGRPVDRRCFFLKVPAGRQQETSYRRTLPRRGFHLLSYDARGHGESDPAPPGGGDARGALDHGPTWSPTAMSTTSTAGATAEIRCRRSRHSM